MQTLQSVLKNVDPEKGPSKAQREKLRAKAAKQAQKGVCDPIYKAAINEMLLQQRNDPMPTSLVVINSFDFQLEEIRDEMESRQIYTEVFEIDRLSPEDRLEYLNCFNEMYSTRSLPIIFIKDNFVGNYQGLQGHFAATTML